MIRIKNILTENMRRFGTKNLMPLHESALSDDDILDIIMTYTKDPDKGEAALTSYRETGDFGDASIESNVTRDPRWTGSKQSITDTQTTNRHEIEEYLMSLQPNDIRIVSGEMSYEEIEQAAAENNFTNDGSFDTDMVIETPKYKIGLLLTAYASGGSDYGFVDAEVNIEFAITGYTDKATNQQFKVNYNTTPYTKSKYRNFDSDMEELLRLY